MKRLACLAPLLLSVSSVIAQTTDDAATASPTISNGDAAAAGGMAALLSGGCGLAFCALWLAFWLGIAIWVMKDAKRRNSPNATLVTILAWIPATTVIGLIVHLVTRPKTIGGSNTTPPSNL